MTDFDPDAPALGEGIFGLPMGPDEARVWILPVPWEATASSGRGTRGAPGAVLAASGQVDLFDPDFGDAWREGFWMAPQDPRFVRWADAAEADAQDVIAAGGGMPVEAARVDALADLLRAAVADLGRRALAAGRVPAVLGGDHSVPLGLLDAISEAYPGVGLLHLDAHADLRPAYMGFRSSHASIMHNALELPGIRRLVGVGWRDLGRAEVLRATADPDRVVAFYDHDLGRDQARGRPWDAACADILAALPPQVYVSFDIDGLDPSLCPGTGTPVPGGLSFREVQVLLARLADERQVVGFDLCEVGAGAWDANVGARVLHKLCGCAVRSGQRGCPWSRPPPPG